MSREIDKQPYLVLPDPGANSLEILANCKRTARESGWTPGMIDSLQDDMLAGSREDLMDVVFDYFTVIQPQSTYVHVNRMEVS